MLSVLLRSGDIKDYTALGQEGTPVYAVASQFRETIKLRVKGEEKGLGKKFADYLAIPQRNDQGSKIDWYVPFESERADGKYLIVPWTSATDEERAAALQELNIFERGMLEFGRSLKNTENLKGDLLLFSRILCGGNDAFNLYDADNLKALRFPNPEYVYLVNNRPVITFWGFAEKNTKIQGNPFLSLEPKPATEIAPPVSAPVTTAVTDNKKGCLRWFLFSLPFLILLPLLAFFFLRGCVPTAELTLPKVSSTPPEITKVDSAENYERCLDQRLYRFDHGVWHFADGTEVKDSALIQQLSQLKDTSLENCRTVVREVGRELEKVVEGRDVNPQSVVNGSNDTIVNDNPPTEPVSPETTTEPVLNINDNISTQDAPNPPDVKDENKLDTPITDNRTTPVDLDEQQSQQAPRVLDMPLEDIKQGKLDFLNGKWNAGSGIQDKTTGKPLRLKYDFKDGKGQVKVERGDGVQCVGDVTAAMRDKGLSIANTGTATCTDGSTYQLPNVSCQPDSNGKANCQGEYGQGKKFPITIKSN